MVVTSQQISPLRRQTSQVPSSLFPDTHTVNLHRDLTTPRQVELVGPFKTQLEIPGPFHRKRPWCEQGRRRFAAGHSKRGKAIDTRILTLRLTLVQ